MPPPALAMVLIIARQASAVGMGWLVGLRVPVREECPSAVPSSTVSSRRCKVGAAAVALIQSCRSPCLAMRFGRSPNLQTKNLESIMMHTPDGLLIKERKREYVRGNALYKNVWLSGHRREPYNQVNHPKVAEGARQRLPKD